MTNILIRNTAFFVLLFSIAGAVLAQNPTIRVTVYGTHEGGNIAYHYKVINNGDVALDNFIIGNAVDNEDSDGYPQLDRRPLGWSYGKVGETGTEILLSPTSTSQPPYWASSLCGKQEFSNHCLEWKVISDGQAYVIPSGQSLAGFSVTVALFDNKQFPHNYNKAGQVVGLTAGPDDDMYLRSGFKTSYWDAKTNAVTNIWGQLEIVDTTPPTLSITLSPDTIHQNGKYVPITATITTKDDYDPQPAIKLLSITANEPIDKDDIKAKLYTDDRHFQLKAEHDGKSHAGRIYTVTYFATDGSGNQKEATATVTVPHERKEHEDRRDDKDQHDKHDKKDDKKDNNDHGRDH